MIDEKSVTAGETQLGETQIVEIVKRYLEPYQPLDYRLIVINNGIRHSRDDWWEVVVQPDKEDIRSYDYYGRLADAENDIEENEQLKISLVPVLPG